MLIRKRRFCHHLCTVIMCRFRLDTPIKIFPQISHVSSLRVETRFGGFSNVFRRSFWSIEKNVFVHLLVMKWEIKYSDSTERKRLLTFLRILQKYLFYFFLFDSLVHILLVRFYWHLIGSHEFTHRTFVTWNHFRVIVVFMFSQITSTRKCWTA